MADNTIFPGNVGGAGPFDVVAITVTAGVETTPVNAAATMAAYRALSTADAARHDRFADIVRYFQQYGQPVGIESDGDTVITLTFERKGMFEDSVLGVSSWDDTSDRANAFRLGQAYLADDAHGVTVVAVTVNGVAQTS